MGERIRKREQSTSLFELFVGDSLVIKFCSCRAGSCCRIGLCDLYFESAAVVSAPSAASSAGMAAYEAAEAGSSARRSLFSYQQTFAVRPRIAEPVIAVSKRSARARDSGPRSARSSRTSAGGPSTGASLPSPLLPRRCFRARASHTNVYQTSCRAWRRPTRIPSFWPHRGQ